MKLSDIDYFLPQNLIAQFPLHDRDDSNLMVLDFLSQKVEYKKFKDLLSILTSGSLLVLNESKVIPARLIGKKETGGQVELLLVRKEKELEFNKQIWIALGKSHRPLKEGMKIIFSGLEATIVEKFALGEVRISLESKSESINNSIEKLGKIPLPPYIKRPACDTDKERYQTVFASTPGSVAAPTAGLHFSELLLENLHKNGIKTAYITLHVGPGTFRPIKTQTIEEHKMDEEYYFIPQNTIDLINETKKSGRPVIAVGTTVVRTLESCFKINNKLCEGWGKTDIFIYPPFHFNVIDWLITNFHLPKSSLLTLVCSLGGTDFVLSAYKQAIDKKYRFYSYGDAMLLRKL